MNKTDDKYPTYTVYGVWILQVRRGNVVNFEGAFDSSLSATKHLFTLAGDEATIYYHDLTTHNNSSHVGYSMGGWIQTT